MHPIPARILLLLLFFSSLVAAANFTQCLEDFRKKDPSTTGGVDLRGRPTTPAAAFGFTYETCLVECGKDSESFKWKEFAQLFSSWLLPWLALISQLPFGSGDHADDFVSVALSVGSPALAAYSLVITSLNARSVYHRAQPLNDDNKKTAVKALTRLQQVPLELTKGGHLASIPTNEQWKEIVSRLNKRNSWSIATGSSVAWVVIAFIFTLIDSFVSLDNSIDGGYDGHAVGTLWLWSLCLVIGWLWVPTFTSSQLRDAVDHANLKGAEEAAKEAKKARKAAKRTPESPVQEMANVRALTRSMSFQKSPEESVFGVPGIPEEKEDGREESIQETLQGVDPTQQVAPRSSVNPEVNNLLVRKVEFGSLNRDELRLAAMFNYSRMMRYLVLVDDVLRDLGGEGGVDPCVFPPGAFASMFNALFFALILQCGTTAAAMIIIIFTPTIGLGCRSLGYALYGGVAIVIMFLTIISTIFARISETRKKRSGIVKKFTAFIAIALRRISLFLAFINAAGLIVLSCFQFSHFLDNCYCNASVIGRGTDSYFLTSYQGWVSTMRTARTSATALAVATMGTFMIFLGLMSGLTLRH